MAESGPETVKGLAALFSGLLAIGLIAYVLLTPGAAAGLHPIPLVALLVVTVAVAFWEAYVLLR